MQENNNRFIIALQVVRELEDKLNDLNLQQAAKVGLQSIDRLVSDGIAIIQGEESDGRFADKVFLYVFDKFRIKNKLFLITQDKNLARDILDKNNQQSAKGKTIVCHKIKKDGTLGNFPFNRENTSEFKKSKLTAKTTTNIKSKIEKFKLCTNITTLPDECMKVSVLPKEGDYVLVQGGKIKLIREIAKGGEGSVFETDTQYVAKIYIKEKITQRRYEKIKLMLNKKFECNGVCYPVSMVHNERNEFVGYLMPKAKGVEIGKSIFKKPLFEKKLPNWNRKNLAELCVTILEKINYLHERNIILGDINPANILVVSPKEVYFVDTDSYQIEGFPCPVGTENFTASEIQGKNYAEFLRTMGNEYFALATLLFMIMLPGKPPYSQQDGASASENIKKGSFPYPLGESSTKKAPDGAWRFMWSHLPRKAIKQAFYKSFQKNEEYFIESKRLNAKDWLARFREYVHLFESGKLQEQDSMSIEIYPTRHKKQKGVKYIVCKDCGIEKPEKYTKNKRCFDCANREYERRNEERNRIVKTLSCKSCGNDFDMTKGEYDFYIKKRLSMPKRCGNCREYEGSYGGYNNYNANGYYFSNSFKNANINNNSGGILQSVVDFFKKL